MRFSNINVKQQQLQYLNQYRDTKKTLFLKSLLTFHVLVFLYFFLYPIVTINNFKKKYVLIYIIFVFLLIVHWRIVGECFISYFEKKTINKNYKAGSLKFSNPSIDNILYKIKIYSKNYSENKIKKIKTLQYIIFIILFSLVIYRSFLHS